MAFLSHDISMLRLFETFLENTPQLVLFLHGVLRTNRAEPSQGEGRGGAVRGAQARDQSRFGQDGLSRGCKTLSCPYFRFSDVVLLHCSFRQCETQPWAWAGRVELRDPMVVPLRAPQRLRVRREVGSLLGSGKMLMWMWRVQWSPPKGHFAAHPGVRKSQVLLQ